MKTYISTRLYNPATDVGGNGGGGGTGDGLLADQGHGDFGSLIGPGGNTDQGQEGVSNSRVRSSIVENADINKPNGTPTKSAGTEGATVTPPVAPPVTAAATVTPPTTPDLAAVIKSTVEATANAMGQGRQQQQQTSAAAPELTSEQFNAKYGITMASEETITHLLGQDPKRAAATLNNLFQSNLTAALRMANDVMEAKLTQLQGRLDPHIKSWTTHQQEQASKNAKSQFDTEHPDLADPKHARACDLAKDALLAKVQSGQVRFTTQKEANAAVAQVAREVLGLQAPMQGGITNNLPANLGSGHNAPATSGRTMASASTAGRTGNGTASKPSIVDEVFGPDAR